MREDYEFKKRRGRALGCNRWAVPMTFAFSQALALESASDSTYNEDTGTYIFTADDLVSYAKIVAYKVAANLDNGFQMDPDDDPLTYIDCDGGGDVGETDD